MTECPRRQGPGGSSSQSLVPVRYVAVLLGAGILYGVSCAPGALWQDSGLIQYRVWHGDMEGFLGLAISHPLYYIVAIMAGFIPLGEFAHRVNLISALAGAVAVANLYLLVRLWLGREFPAVVAAVTLALSHTFWQHASMAETYTLWAALFLGELVLLLHYTRTKKVGYLYLLGLMNGLAIAVHMLASIPLICYAVFIAVLLAKSTIRIHHVAIIAGLWVLGALPYEYLIVRTMIHSGDVVGTLASAAFGDRWRGDVLNTSLSWRVVKENLLYIALNVPTPNVLLFFLGGYTLFAASHRIKAGPRPPTCHSREGGNPATHRSILAPRLRGGDVATRILPEGLKTGSGLAFRSVVLALCVLFFVFAFRYTISDRYAFFIPFYCLAAVLIGVGVQEICMRVHGRVVPLVILLLSLLPVPMYAVAPQLAQRMNVRIGTRQDIPYRNDYTYFLQPWKTRETSADRFAVEALMSAQQDAIILADTTTVAPLLYAQEVKGLRPDVKIVTGIARSEGAPLANEQTIGQLLEQRPVYVVSSKRGYCPAFVLGRYELAQAGVLWCVVNPQSRGIQQQP